MSERSPTLHLDRGLKIRHIELMSIGGAIGVGLFLGSAGAIHRAGPGLLLGYVLGGVAIFFIMRALGELLLYRPVTGSFVAYAEEFVGPFAAFATGWSYWFMWVVTGIAELTAIGIYVHYWFTTLPQWVTVLAALVLLYGTNLATVTLFGEMEFWFALIKVGLIVALIIGGLIVAVFHLGPLGQSASLANLWRHGGLLPFGVLGVLLSLQMVMFAFQGVELIGITAGEAQNPQQVLPRATNGVIYRILIFYLGALLVIMTLVPWPALVPTVSPFIQVFDRMGVPGATGIVTLVVVSAAASSCNSGIYSTGRMLYALAAGGRASAGLAVLNRRHLPARAITVSALAMLAGVILNYLVPDRVFVWVTSISLIGTIWTWGVILLAHRNYRRAVRAGRARAVSYRMPLAPAANWAVLAFLALVTGLLALDPGTRVALYVAPVWFALVGLAYRRLRIAHTPAMEY